MSHHRECAIALLNKLGIPIPKDPMFIYCAPHGLGRFDLSGMWDIDVWHPEIGKNFKIAASAHGDKSGSIKHHDLTNPEKYMPDPCFSYWLVTWKIRKHKLVFRYYKLPSLEELP